ncbi:MAG: AbrB family transcriptional regulator [Oceanospirillaceae bacterium]|nr:AbrB family transcriptional regulator [Oceanospirillaceae bacterium]
MRRVSIFKNGKNQAIRLPKEFEFQGVTELEIIKSGDAIVLRPAKPGWASLADLGTADSGFLEERIDVVEDDGRVFL